ncbi:hypothetical protein AB0I10_12040 [Streptomyces sp. NPDC050636]|uniref:hypothetical protein n=1 Tax=Streptomyces sp. NPDC050636 TaxID=3154510 RepID=UPI0034476E3F
MQGNEEHYNAVLADIILSEKVGVGHVRLVGDLISVNAQLSMATQGNGGLPLEQHADMVEAMLDLEDAYHRAWEEVTAAPSFEERVPKLGELERALRNAVEGTIEIARRYQISAERPHLD